jgi:hypothetical protein
MRSLAVLFVVVSSGLLVAQGAGASSIVSTGNVTSASLVVDDKGQALVTYTEDGTKREALASGAENARPPTPGGTQVDFTYDYAGGQTQAGTFSCRPYTGPQLAFAVAACDAPDGSYWALQQWQRLLPDYGAAPTPALAAHELHLSHWTGPLPVLKVETDWSYRRWEHLFGTYSDDGNPVFGFKSTSSGRPLDSFGRNIYLDSFDSNYQGGAGTWMRVNSWLTHKGTGAWCYGVSPHGSSGLTGAGSKYRLTVLGPGVTPDVSVTVRAPGGYDALLDRAQNAKIAALHDNLCKPN